MASWGDRWFPVAGRSRSRTPWSSPVAPGTFRRTGIHLSGAGAEKWFAAEEDGWGEVASAPGEELPGGTSPSSPESQALPTVKLTLDT